MPISYQDKAILDFGSSKITAAIGQRGVNGTLILSGMGAYEYAGFSDGQWFEPEQLGFAIGRAIAHAETNARTKITELYVGVPGDFSTCKCKNVQISFNKKHRITEIDVEALHEQGNTFGNDPDFTLINSQPIYYTLDDDRRLVEPVGLQSIRLGGHISYILAENRFIYTITQILKELGIQKIEFVSSLLSEALFLFDDKERDNFVVMIDVGHITSSVVLARGDGILCQYSFPLGGGYITGDLAMCLGISYGQADILKKKVVLSLSPQENDVYTVLEKDSNLSFNAYEVNEIVRASLRKLAGTVAKCLKMCEYDYPNHIPYHLTGGGISYIHGAKNYLSELLARPVELAVPKLPQLNRPELSAFLGLLDMVLANNEEEPVGFFKRILEKLTGNK